MHTQVGCNGHHGHAAYGPARRKKKSDSRDRKEEGHSDRGGNCEEMREKVVVSEHHSIDS